MINTFSRIVAAGSLALLLGGCTGGSSTYPGTPPPAVAPNVVTTKYTQIERLARPAVKELFERFVDHQVSNAAEPYSDPTLQASIQNFTDALRPPKNGADYGKALAGVLYPDEITVDLSQTGNAAYLAYETGGVTSSTKSTFGGRDVADDVVTISLGAVFGGTLPALKLQPEDNQENQCLSTQNLKQSASQVASGSFPYLPAPH